MVLIIDDARCDTCIVAVEMLLFTELSCKLVFQLLQIQHTMHVLTELNNKALIS